MSIGEPIPARNSDPETSHEGHAHVKITDGSQQERLLMAFAWAGQDGFTDEEACAAGDGVSLRGYWKRCSDLRNGGFIEWLLDEEGRPETRRGSSGLKNRVSRITERGWKALADL